MRLGWRYHTRDGAEVAGNSARDLELLVEDEMPTPPDGTPFRLRLQLRRAKDAVSVIASVNGHTFARKVLPGLQGQVGKIAVGCRNYECAFDDLVVSGKVAERPGRRGGGAAD
jgi:serine/threonine-protein kinase